MLTVTSNVYVVEFDEMPELPVSGWAIEGYYMDALTDAIKTGVITEPGKYAINIPDRRFHPKQYEIYTIQDEKTNGLGLVFTKIVCTCLACPSQWEAWTEDGTYYYIRYRWGHLSVTKDDEKLVYERQVGDTLDGVMDNEMLAHIGCTLAEGVSITYE